MGLTDSKGQKLMQQGLKRTPIANQSSQKVKYVFGDVKDLQRSIYIAEGQDPSCLDPQFLLDHANIQSISGRAALSQMNSTY